MKNLLLGLGLSMVLLGTNCVQERNTPYMAFTYKDINKDGLYDSLIVSQHNITINNYSKKDSLLWQTEVGVKMSKEDIKKFSINDVIREVNFE
jgi:hypothetical protein